MYRRIPKDAKYLYHFTSPDTFYYIMKDVSLRFNFFSKVNDPKESKYWSASLNKEDKYIFDLNCPDKKQNILLYSEFSDLKIGPFDKMKNKIQVLCFTIDKYDNEMKCDKDNAYLFRGFGNPYFWSHYGSSKTDRSLQEGVCLQLNLDEIENKYLKLNVDHHFGKRKVNYSDEVYEGNPEFISFSDIKRHEIFDLVKRCIFKHQDHYLFKKTKFWEAENEYRFVIFNEIEEYKFLDIKGCIASIIIGEDIKIEDQNKILAIAKENFIAVSKMDWGNGYPTALKISKHETKYKYD